MQNNVRIIPNGNEVIFYVFNDKINVAMPLSYISDQLKHQEVVNGEISKHLSLAAQCIENGQLINRNGIKKYTNGKVVTRATQTRELADIINNGKPTYQVFRVRNLI